MPVPQKMTDEEWAAANRAYEALRELARGMGQGPGDVEGNTTEGIGAYATDNPRVHAKLARNETDPE